MNQAALVHTSASSAETRDAEAREHARVLLANLRTLVEEIEDVLELADRFSTVTTWLPDLGRTEVHLERTVGALAAAGGLIAQG